MWWLRDAERPHVNRMSLSLIRRRVRLGTCRIQPHNKKIGRECANDPDTHLYLQLPISYYRTELPSVLAPPANPEHTAIYIEPRQRHERIVGPIHSSTSTQIPLQVRCLLNLQELYADALVVMSAHDGVLFANDDLAANLGSN